METKKGKGSKTLTCVYEMIGTALLIIPFNWSGERSEDGFGRGPDASAIAITLFASILIFG